MKRLFVIPLIILLLSTLACSVGSIPFLGSNPAATAKPTSPFDVTPTVAKATAVPKKVSNVYDDFTSDTGAWEDPFVVTTQAQQGADAEKISFADSKMTFQFLAKETYAYRFYRSPIGADAVIEAKYQAFNQTHNGIALICRASAQHDTWYEFRVSSLNLYNIFIYDRSVKETQGKNPYVSLQSGAINIKTLYPTRENVIQATCKGSTLTLGANGTEVVTVSDSTLTKGEMVGVGAMSSDLLPVSIKFDYFSVKKP